MRRARWIFAALLWSALAFSACGSRTGLETSGFTAGGESRWVVDLFRQSAVTKVDLLLTIDNSISMADKQVILAEAVPLLVKRLISAGSAINPVSDVHVGVITSSLGSHGSQGPKDVCVSVEDDDHAHLLGELRGLPGTWKNSGFLAWDPRHERLPPGDDDVAVFVDKLRQHVQSAGEHGCGYEATLESWYRFLIDPEPPQQIVVNAGIAQRQGVDQTILQQRAAFLRPDSLVAIIMLSDENDCSLQDEGVPWLVTQAGRMFRSTSVCAKSANDPCCQSCQQVRVAGCADPSRDPECQKGSLVGVEDELNLRCWEQKRRFGVDFLYPTSRYSQALSALSVTSSAAGKSLPNPLFVAPPGLLVRDRSLVYLAGIVGVPWQDIADEASLSGPGLRYLTARQLRELARWDVILGDPQANPPIPPDDPFMRETHVDRSSLAIAQHHPILAETRLVPANSQDPQANVINGHEQVDVGQTDLQYACTFPLDTPRVCNGSVSDADQGCDCFAEDQAYNRSLCQPPTGGPAGIVQHYAKAYPGLRHLQVLKEVGDAGIVASICPKVLDKASSDYGYNPAVEALISRVTDSVFRRCLSDALPLGDDGRVSCEVVQAFPKLASGCDCEGLGLQQLADSTLARAVQRELQQSGQCSAADPTCTALCRCQLPQLFGQDLAACQNSIDPKNLVGFCYINAVEGEPNVGRADFVSDCSRAERRDLRLLGGVQNAQVLTLLACPAD